MREIETWQIPAADDISPDGLEYLFSSQYPPDPEPPWVRVSVEPACISEPVPGEISLKARIEVLSQKLKVMSGELQSATFQIGYLKGRLAEREEELKQLPDYRARAARSVLTERQLVSLQSELEQVLGELSRLKESWWCRLESAGRELFRPATQKGPYLPIIPWVMLLTFWFVVSVTLIGLRDHWWN